MQVIDLNSINKPNAGFVTISQLYFTYFGEYPVCDRQGINNHPGLPSKFRVASNLQELSRFEAIASI
jgi:hypothetical protein